MSVIILEETGSIIRERGRRSIAHQLLIHELLVFRVQSASPPPLAWPVQKQELSKLCTLKR